MTNPHPDTQPHPETKHCPDNGLHLDAARLRELEAAVHQLADEVTDLTALLTTQLPDANSQPDPAIDTDPTSTPTDAPTTDADPAQPELAFATLTDWVEQHFCTVFTRTIGGDTRWCPHWTEHPEAVIRLQALWRSWETLRLDPNLGLATWLTNYLDPQLTQLLARTGTFANCTPGRHQRTPELPGIAEHDET